MDVIDQVIQIYTGANGFLDDLAVDQVNDFAVKLVEHFNTGEAAQVRTELAEKKAIDDELAAKIKDVITKFKSGWAASA